MTEKQLRQKVIDIAKKDLGAKQYSARHAAIIRDFNKIPGMGDWMRQAYPWCAATVSVWGYRAGLGDIFYPSASCNAMINLYKSHKRWMEDDSYVPQPGDLVMYDWQALNGGDCKGEADHVGLVISVSHGYITAIEGNRQDAVATRTFEIDWRYLRGFCLPDYASKATKDEPKDSKVDYAKALQIALNTAYGLNLKVDGKVLAKTKGAIDIHYLWYIKKKPIVNVHVSWLQGCLKDLGYDIEVDGSFGPATERIVKQFQADAGIDIDGYCGVQTHLAILRKLNK